jgi:general stress protein CsbA
MSAWPPLSVASEDRIQNLASPPEQFSNQTFQYSADARIGLAVTMVMVSTVAILTNILVIVTIIASKRLRIITSVFLVNLAICDLMVGAIVMPQIAKNALENTFDIPQVSSL